jgi:hypothetical protein
MAGEERLFSKIISAKGIKPRCPGSNESRRSFSPVIAGIHVNTLNSGLPQPFRASYLHLGELVHLQGVLLHHFISSSAESKSDRHAPPR